MIHIYGQLWEHDEATIVGDVDALCRLRDAIQSAIDHRKGTTKDFTCDGEGYTIIVKATDRQDLRLPYTNEESQDHRTDVCEHWSLE